MSTVFNTVRDAAGNLLSGTTTIDLIVFSGGAISFQGFVDLSNVNTDYTINKAATVSITNGSWSATLRGNAGIEDAYAGTVTTYYRITETTSGVSRTYYILAPNDSSSYWVGDLIAIDPQTFSTSITFDSLSDVDVTSPSDGDIVRFDAASGHWTKATIPGLSSAVYKDIIDFAAPGTCQTLPGTMAIVIPYAFVITGVYLHADGAPSGNRIICDVNINDSSIFTSVSDRRPRIASGSNTSTQGIPGAGDSATGTAGALLSVDIDEIGISPSEGTDLTVSIGATYT